MSQKIKYLYDNIQIADILSQGFAHICQQKPKFPINYLAKYLKNHTIKNNQKVKLFDKLENNQKLNFKLNAIQLLIQEQIKKKIEKENQIQKENQNFIQKIKNTIKHQMILDFYCNWIKQKFNLTGVYMGQLEFKSKKIDINLQDGQQAHIQLEKEKIIKFKYSNQTQKSIVRGRILGQDSIVGKLLNQVQTQQNNNAQQSGQGQQDNPTKSQNKGQIYFGSVVGNQELKFFRFPKLGAYYAVSLSIKSYLRQNLFDNNSNKVQIYRKLKHDYEKQMQEKQTKFKQVYDQKVNSGADQKQLQEMQKQFQRQKSQIVKPLLQSFEFFQRKFIVCFDTLGLDREISQNERQKIRQYIKILKQSWQARQKSQLEHDIDLQLKLLKPHLQDGAPQSQNANYTQQFNFLLQEQEKQIPSHEEVQKVKQNQKLLELQSNTVRFQKTKQYISDQKYSHFWDHLLELNILKYAQIFKQFLILLGYKKDMIQISGTNLLDWQGTKEILKKDKQKIMEQITGTTPRGHKPQAVSPYQKCVRIQRNLQAFQPSAICPYNIYLAFILRFIKLYVKIRVQDKQSRVFKIQTERENRQNKIKQAQQKANEKKQKLQNLKVQLEQKGELQTFDQQAWNAQYDEENPAIEIPPEVFDQYDLDLQDPKPEEPKVEEQPKILEAQQGPPSQQN